MLRCVILDDFQDVATSYADWSVLADLDLRVATTHLTGPDLLAELGGAEVVVVMRERTPLSRELLRQLPDLRLVVTTGMRNAAIDLDACGDLGITVCGTASLPTPTVELTWGLIHALTRHLVEEALPRENGWQRTVGLDLAGARLGLLGVGRIGSRVAAVGRAFDMDVVAWSPHLSDERAAAAGVRRVPRHELFAGSDVVSLHLVLGESTRGVVGAAELAGMRETAYLVNTSRSGLVDAAALLACLDRGGIAGAGLDVWDVEPLPAGDPLAGHPRVLGTPHLGYVTRGNYATFYGQAVEDVAAWRAGDPVRLLS